jgi:ferrous-iron efflux pump FieF
MGKHFKMTPRRQDQNKLKRLATYASVFVSLILIFCKSYAWNTTHSISLLSSLADSWLDFIASAINMIAVHHAIKPPDAEHRFGHGKIEALAALFQSIIIIVSGGFILKEALIRFSNPTPIEHVSVGVIVTFIAIALTSLLVWFQKHVIQKTKSLAILADSTHYRADLYLNVGVLLSIGLYTLFKWAFIDVFFGIGIAFYIMYSAYKIVHSSLKVLLDSELPDLDRENILEIVHSHPKVKKCYHLRTRTSGREEFIQGHLILKEKMNVESSYKITKDIQKELSKSYPNAEFLFQTQPHNTEEDHHDLHHHW